MNRVTNIAAVNAAYTIRVVFLDLIIYSVVVSIWLFAAAPSLFSLSFML